MYFFEAGSSSKQLHFQKKNFFRSRYFLRTVTFCEKLVLRNQLYCIYTWKDLTIIHSFKYTMDWSDFEIPHFFWLKIANNVWISIQDVLPLLRKLVIIVESSNKLWMENRSNKLKRFKRCCNKNLLKIVKNWTARHFWRANNVAMKFWKGV